MPNHNKFARKCQTLDSSAHSGSVRGRNFRNGAGTGNDLLEKQQQQQNTKT